jgi:hypothetical protein
MEGWFPLERGERNRLRIAEAAERHSPLDHGSQGGLSSDRTTRLQQKPARSYFALTNALPNARVDAGCESVPVNGEVPLDIPLHGKWY